MKAISSPARSRWLRFATYATHAVTLAFLVAGCTGVYVSSPIGEKPHALVRSEWEGSWTAGKDAVIARVVDPVAGKIQFSETSLRDGDFVTKTTDVIVRESGDWLFATVMDESKPARYEWARIKLDEGQVTVWLPRKDAFLALVQSGKLKGQREDDDNVILAPLSAADLKALTTGALGVPFKWDEPLVLHRLPH